LIGVRKSGEKRALKERERELVAACQKTEGGGTLFLPNNMGYGEGRPAQEKFAKRRRIGKASDEGSCANQRQRRGKSSKIAERNVVRVFGRGFEIFR